MPVKNSGGLIMPHDSRISLIDSIKGIVERRAHFCSKNSLFCHGFVIRVVEPQEVPVRSRYRIRAERWHSHL
jgi:hypothetical protein